MSASKEVNVDIQGVWKEHPTVSSLQPLFYDEIKKNSLLADSSSKCNFDQEMVRGEVR